MDEKISKRRKRRYFCKICKNSKDNKIYSAREMMFGLDDKFDYLECGGCGCVQLLNIPSNFSRYYPSNYYSIKKTKKTIINNFKQLLKIERDKYGIFRKSLIGKFLFKFFPRYDYYKIFKNISKDKKILDVGCGNGDLLKVLTKMKYTKLWGVDPYINKSILDKNLKLIKGDFLDINEKFDVIMFHHSFEHMKNPNKIFKHISNLLNNDGICIIRIPIVPNYAWKKYKINWVQLDAPRHIFLHSIKSLNILAPKSNLKLDKIEFDSNFFQFASSELYLKGIPLIKHNYNKYYSRKQINNFSKLAKKMNFKKMGDQGIFYFSHS